MTDEHNKENKLVGLYKARVRKLEQELVIAQGAFRKSQTREQHALYDLVLVEKERDHAKAALKYVMENKTPAVEDHILRYMLFDAENHRNEIRKLLTAVRQELVELKVELAQQEQIARDLRKQLKLE